MSFRKFFVLSTILLVACVCLVFFWQVRAGQKDADDISRSLRAPAASGATSPCRVDLSRIEAPPPVRRYFRRVLKDGQACIASARFVQSGALVLRPGGTEWAEFEAVEVVSGMRPGLLWNAKIDIAPLLHVRVLDSYRDGRARGSVRLLSALSLAEETGDPRLDTGALFRYLAEAVWYPTALLPGPGLRWQPVDERHAVAILKDAGHTVSLEFTFNADDEIVRIYSEDRYGLFDGEYRRYPWEGRFADYVERDGMRVPQYGEVGWHLPDGFWLFWKGRIEAARYDLG